MNELERLGGSLGGAAVGRRLQRGASGSTAGRTASGEMGHDTKGSMKRGIVGSTVAEGGTAHRGEQLPGKFWVTRKTKSFLPTVPQYRYFRKRSFKDIKRHT